MQARKKYSKNFIKKRSFIEIEGTLSRIANGPAFVIPESHYKLGKDIYIPAKYIGNAFNKDKVIVRVRVKDKNISGRLRGEIIKVTHSAKNPLIGKIKKHEKNYVIMPLSDQLNFFVKIGNPGKNLKKEQIVTYYMKSYPQQGIPAEGEIIDIIGYESDPDIDEKIVLSKYNLIRDFSKKAIQEAMHKKMNPKDYKGRKDLTGQ